MATEVIDPERLESFYRRLKKEAEERGYHLNPDADFVRLLLTSLLINGKRYGYPACPCRLASGRELDDRDIICPCDYRDADLTEYGSCYCALYVSADIAGGRKKAASIPERRPPEGWRRRTGSPAAGSPSPTLPYPVWRCAVCGYLCARDEPPDTCPICKAKKERFERFL